MSNYIQEIRGRKYLTPSDWQKKDKKENDEFKARLSELPKAQAVALCRKFADDASLSKTSSGLIAAQWLRDNT